MCIRDRKKAKMSKTCYLFLLPYLIVFTAFYILPVLMSVFYSFTYYNVLEPARFVGVDNYINLLLADDVFLIAVKNTFLLAAITGPLGYIMAFLFAWFINELPRYIRAFAVVVFYAPTISGQAYLVLSLIHISLWPVKGSVRLLLRAIETAWLCPVPASDIKR